MAIEDWKIVVRDEGAVRAHPAAARLFDEAAAACPTDYILQEDVIGMLPRKPVDGLCRMCGSRGRLTKEHIPPKAAGNLLTSSRHTFTNWLERAATDELGRGVIEQGGIFGYTLCDTCNSYTGTEYGTAYKRWAEITRELMNGLLPPSQLDRSPKRLGWDAEFGSQANGGIRPGAAVRQVLSCMCSLSGSWSLAARHPELRRIILEQSLEPMPAGMELGFALYYGPRARITGPQLAIDLREETWRWVIELAYPPFAFLLVLASNSDDPGLGLLMADWTLIDPADSKKLEGVVELGFGWTPYPGDYRTSAAIAAEAGSPPPT